jgi:L-ascorbate metabolism protein UlaG (beta-lactamase superfamily)
MAKLTYYGHSCFLVESGGFAVIVDPFLTGNPRATVRAEDIACDFIVVTHAHGDHLGDAVPIAKRTGATIITNYEIANHCEKEGAKVHPLHIGGGASFPFGRAKLTQAFHGSSFADGSYGGNPAGVVLRLPDAVVYHAGDTGLFSDMQLIGEEGLDAALLPIGDNFTMGPDDAVRAVRFLKPKMVVPMHYNTFDVIGTDPQSFRRKAEREAGVRVVVLEPGQSVEVG